MLRLHRRVDPAGSASDSTSAALGTVLQASRHGGQALAGPTKTFLEASFGVSLDPVRIHNDQRAAQMSHSVGAEAFTYGRHIYFGAGRYRPQTPSGAELLSHEIVHTIQQGFHDERVPTQVPVSHPEDASEREAEQLSRQMMRGEAVGQARTDRLRGAVGTRRLQPQIQRAKGLSVAVYETKDHGGGYGDAPSEPYKLKANSLDEAGTQLNTLVAATKSNGSGTAVSQLSFYGHAAPGSQSVGAGEGWDSEKEISVDSINTYPAKYTKIYTPLANGASVFLRGCNAGAGQEGLDMLKKVKSSAKSLASKDITAYAWTGTSYHRYFLWADWYKQTGERVSSEAKKPKLTWEKLKKLKKK